MQTLQKLAPRHPQIAQRKQRYQVGRVFGQATVLDLGVRQLMPMWTKTSNPALKPTRLRRSA